MSLDLGPRHERAPALLDPAEHPLREQVVHALSATAKELRRLGDAQVGRGCPLANGAALGAQELGGAPGDPLDVVVG